MSKFNLAKKGNTFIPATDEDKRKIDKIGQGEVIRCKSVNQRNVKFHKKFFAMAQLAWDNCPENIAKNYPNQNNVPEKFWKELVKRAGYYDEQVNFKGVTEYTAKSIAFDNMGEDEFESLYSAVLDVVLLWILPGTDRELITEMIANFG